MCSERGPHDTDQDLAQPVREVEHPVLQSAFFVLVRRAAGLDNPPSYCYILISTPAGPLSKDMLSLGGSFIGGKA